MHKNIKIKDRENKGFTLLEVMIALVVLAFGLLAIAGMQVIAIRSNAQSRDVTEATTLAKDALDYFKSLPYSHPALDDTNPDNNSDLTDADPDNADHQDVNHPFNPDGTPVGKFGLLWNVADATPRANTKTVVVSVSWLSGPNQVPKQVQLHTIISNPQ